MRDAGVSMRLGKVAPLVLASASRYRADLLVGAGLEVTVHAPDIDERSADHLFHSEGPEALAVELAGRKARAIASDHPGCWIIAADQVGVIPGLGTPPGRMLTKKANVEEAVDQLISMSGTKHHLVNGVVVLDVDTGGEVRGVDVQVVTMRRFDRAQARSYVVAFEPFDSSGSYRIEDQRHMAEGAGLVAGVTGEDPSGVVGLPLPMLQRMFGDLERLVMG